MQTKIRLGVLFGGQSEEHEVSIESLKNLIPHINPEKYEIFPIGVDKKGSWHFFSYSHFLISLKKNYLPMRGVKDRDFPLLEQPSSPKKLFFSPCVLKKSLDVVFPILHGPFGEDGTIQGLMELAQVPYVGSDSLSSAMCMDKGVMKEMLRGAGLPVANYSLLHFNDPINKEKLLRRFSLPLFIKPVGQGSSVGITKVKNEKDLLPAIKRAFKYNDYILVEELIEGKELECSILGNDKLEVSLPGEVIPNDEFYSHKAKCMGREGIDFTLPAKLPEKKIEELQNLAVQAFKVLRCEGMARVDFFLKKDGTLLINELNTIPGFTPTSLYPILWEISGKPYPKLIDELIELAIKRFYRKNCHK